MLEFHEGIVEDNKDPLKLGRVRVRVVGLHTADRVKLPVQDLPWAFAAQPLDGSISGVGKSPVGVLQGSTVIIYFRDPETKQQPVVFAVLGGVPETLPDVSQGFSDPDGEYPKEAGLSDTNKLARGELEGTSIETQNKNKDSIEPSSPANPEYPFNKVYESESGIVIEVDDTLTPNGQGRLRIWHPAGTYDEIHPDGTRVHRTGNNEVIVADKDQTIHVKGKYSISVDGDAEIEVKGNAKTNVKGDEERNIDGDLIENVKGTHKLTVSGGVEEIITGEVKRTVTGTVTDTTVGTKTETATGPYTIAGSPLSI